MTRPTKDERARAMVLARRVSGLTGPTRIYQIAKLIAQDYADNRAAMAPPLDKAGYQQAMRDVVVRAFRLGIIFPGDVSSAAGAAAQQLRDEITANGGSLE
jgi:hypothetical protein